MTRVEEIQRSPELHETLCREISCAKRNAKHDYHSQLDAVCKVLRKWYPPREEG